MKPTSPHLRQSQIHIGLPERASPSETALAILRQAARDIAACIEADPALKLTLPVPHGLLDLLAEVTGEKV